jgi:hypothetical protein
LKRRFPESEYHVSLFDEEDYVRKNAQNAANTTGHRTQINAHAVNPHIKDAPLYRS